MNVASIMTRKVVTVDIDDSLKTIRNIFKHVEFHHILVDDGKKLVGIISDRDLIIVLSPFLGTLSENKRDTIILNKRVNQIMSRILITVDKETGIEKAGNLLLENNISCLPVISPQGSIEGIVTWKDHLKFYLKNTKINKHKESRMNSTANLPSRRTQMKISSIMTRNVVTVEMDDSIQKIRDIFNNFDFHHILVLENQKLVGVISDRNFLRTLSPFLDTPSQKQRDLATIKKRAHQIMSRTPITVDAEISIEKADNLLLENNISCLPVISPQGSVEGIVTWKDILKFHLNDTS
jgi:acetoin utilization protein AcuB